jgi:hypothetical protein
VDSSLLRENSVDAPFGLDLLLRSLRRGSGWTDECDSREQRGEMLHY